MKMLIKIMEKDMFLIKKLTEEEAKECFGQHRFALETEKDFSQAWEYYSDFTNFLQLEKSRLVQNILRNKLTMCNIEDFSKLISYRRIEGSVPFQMICVENNYNKLIYWTEMMGKTKQQFLYKWSLGDFLAKKVDVVEKSGGKYLKDCTESKLKKTFKDCEKALVFKKEFFHHELFRNEFIDSKIKDCYFYFEAPVETTEKMMTVRLHYKFIEPNIVPECADQFDEFIEMVFNHEDFSKKIRYNYRDECGKNHYIDVVYKVGFINL